MERLSSAIKHTGSLAAGVLTDSLIFSFEMPPATIREIFKMRDNAGRSPRYTAMLIHQDDISWIANLSASILAWLLLVTFFMFPGSYLSSTYADVLSKELNSSHGLGFIVIAAICLCISLIGLGYLWWRYRENYIWLCNKIFRYDKLVHEGSLYLLTA
jgi:hypothetical protein